MSKNLELKNYCAFCGKKLKETKKGYGGKNRKFHKSCLDIISFPVKEHFNYQTKSIKKIENTDEMRELEYRDYSNKRSWSINQNLKSSCNIFSYP